MTQIRLDWPEVMVAAITGVMRQIAALKAERPERHGADPANGWSLHINGALGEQVFAKYLGEYWHPSVNTFKTLGDVGRWEVRTRPRHDWDLIVRADDDERRSFVLITGVCPNYLVRGWILGRDAKQDQWKRAHGDREEAWFVPAGALHPICEATYMIEF